MKTTINIDALRNVFRLITIAHSVKPDYIPSLIEFQASEHAVNLRYTTRDFSFTYLADAGTTQNGMVILPLCVADLLAGLDVGEATIKCLDNRIEINAGDSTYTVQPVTNIKPPVPGGSEYTKTCRIDSESLRKALRNVLPAAGRQYDNIFIHLASNKSVAFGADGCRMAFQNFIAYETRMHWNFAIQDECALFLVTALESLECGSILTASTVNGRLRFDSAVVNGPVWSLDMASSHCKVPVGPSDIVPDTFAVAIEVNRSDLSASLRRLRLIDRERHRIELVLGSDELRLKSTGIFIESGCEVLPAKLLYGGLSQSVILNASYLSDALSPWSDTARIMITPGGESVLVESGDLKTIVMPIKP